MQNMVHTEKHTLISEGEFHVFNMTEQARAAVRASGIREGSVLIHYGHTTGAAFITEHEAGLLLDLEEALARIAPVANEYKHHWRGWDVNGAAHIGAALLGTSVTVPVLDGDLLIGSFQEIVIVDMEPRSRPCNVVIQVMGE
jgi:secondary thiamine-phosphate synthase enzyme